MTDKISHCNQEVDNDGSSPDAAMSWKDGFFKDFLGKGVATECWNGVKSNVALMARGENVADASKVSLDRLQAAWATTGNEYDV